MRFLLDHNVCASVGRVLRELGHDVVTVTDILFQEAEDQIVATAAVQEQRILVSHDGDMRRIERKISQGHRDRYPTLCRLMLCLPEASAAERLRAFMPAVELEFAEAARVGAAMMFEICERRVRIHR